MAEFWPTSVPQDPRFPSVTFPPGVRAWAVGEALLLARERFEEAE